MSELVNSSRGLVQKQVGVGDTELFLHRQSMEWKAVYMQGKFLIADHNSVNKLLQIQAQIQLQKHLADRDSSGEQKAQSFHSYYNKVDKANQSYVTEVNHQRQKLNDIKVQQELEKEEDLYAQRIVQARNKKKDKKKANKNLVKMGNDKEDFKSVKMQMEEKDNCQVLQKSMIKVQAKRQEKFEAKQVIKVIEDNKPLANNEKILDIKAANEDLSHNIHKKETFLSQQKIFNQKQQINKIDSKEIINSKANSRPLAINSIVHIQIKQPPLIENKPFSVQMEASQVIQINTIKIQSPVKGNQPSILSLDSSVQKKINKQLTSQRAGDQFFFQLHSKIDELQQNIGQMKNQQESVKKISSPPPKVLQNQAPKFKQSAIMIDTKNMLKNLNHQLKEIGLVDPEQDSHITSQYIDNLTGTKMQENNEKVLQAIQQPIVLKKQNKELHVQQAFNFIFSPIQKEQKQIEIKLIKKPQNCRIVSSLMSHQIVQVSPNTNKIASEQRQKLSQQINLLKQVIGQLRVQRIKYQSSSNDKATDELGTPNSIFNKQQIDKQQMSHRVNASVFNNFTQSAVSQIHSNQYRSMISKRVISGKIVKNISPNKMPKIEQQKIVELKQRQVTQNAFQPPNMDNSVQHQQQSKDKSKQSLSITMQEAKSVKIPTGSEQVSQNIQPKFNNIEIVTIKNTTQAIRQKDTGVDKGSLLVNNSIKGQFQMQSSLPRPLNRQNNRSQPPKFIIQQHDSHQKKYQTNIKKQLVNNFQKLQVDSNHKYNTISQQKIDPKKRANKEGVFKTIQSKPASFHPQLNKVIFNKGQNNIKTRIVQLEKSRPQKNVINNNNKNNGSDSKSSKGFRLRRQSQASRQSRASSSIKDAKLSSKGSSIKKQENNKIYVPALQSFGSQEPLKDKNFKQYKNSQQFKESKASTFKIEKRKIHFNYLQIPKFPQTPNTNIKIEEMAQLIKKMNSLLNLQLKQGELHRLVMKKYKNCIMLDLPNSQNLKLVWHYNGKIYVGQWNQPAMLKEGQGLQYMPQKYYYKGNFIGGKRHGFGIMVQQSGNIYQGQWEQGEKHGRGKIYDATIKLNYEGQWKNGKREGIGYLSIENQSNYEGKFLQNYKDGQGIQSFFNGDSYKGSYLKGRFHGIGTYIWSEGDVYQGQFYQGCKHGKGLWTSFIGEIYEGYYKNDKKCGNGKYLWGNGCIFEGEFENDKKNGHGILKYPDGRQIKGIWRQGKLIQQFSSPRKDDKQDPLTHRKSKVVESITLIKVDNKQHKQKK